MLKILYTYSQLLWGKADFLLPPALHPQGRAWEECYPTEP